MMYTTVTGQPGVFNVINLDDNKLVNTFKLEGNPRSWTHVIDKEGNVYIGANDGTNLFRYSPKTKKVENLGVATPGEKSIWALTVDDDGNVYGGTYLNGKVFKYDPKTNQFTDFGPVDPAEDYVRSIAYYDGYIYAGTGSMNGRVWKIDPNTQEKERIEIPERSEYADKYDKMGFVYGLTVIENHLYVFFNGPFAMLVYDLDEEVWLDRIYENVRGGIAISPAHNGKAYYADRSNAKDYHLVEVDTKTGEAKRASLDFHFGLKDCAWLDLPTHEEFPGKAMVTVNYNGEIVMMDFENEIQKKLNPLVEGSPINLQALEKASDGNIYISSYMGSLGAKYDTNTGIFTQFPLGQAEGMGSLGDKMYIGIYPGAYIYELDTTKPLTEGQNPERIFQIGEEQDRPFVITSGDNKVFIGTIPDYAKFGGAVTIYDPETGKREIHRNIVENQAVMGLAYKDGKLYGSTTVSGGLGFNYEDQAKEAKFFVWDVAKGEKEKEFALNIPGVDQPFKAIGGLSFGPDGLLWGASNAVLFAMNPDTGEVVKHIKTGPINWGGKTAHYWRPAYLRWEGDELLYATINSNLVVVNIETMEYKTLVPGTNLMTLDNDGNIYYGQGTRLYKIDVSSQDPVEPVEPEDPQDPEDPEVPKVKTIDIPVKNGAFEERPIIPGWSSFFEELTENVSFGVSSERSKTGEKSLKIVDKSRAETVFVQSDPILVEPGMEYTASAEMFLEEGRASFLLRYYGDDGKQIGKDNIINVDSGHGEWQPVQVTSIAPEGATYARILAGASMIYTTNGAYYDDITLTSKKGKDEISLEIPNASFEEGLIIPGWSSFFEELTGNVSFEVSSECSKVGEQSLKIVDKSRAETVFVQSDPISVEPGIEYIASTEMFLEDGRASFLLRYYGDDGKQIGKDNVVHVDSGHNQWQTVKLTVEAPEGATHARLLAGASMIFTTNGAYYDDFKLYYEKEIPEEVIDVMVLIAKLPQVEELQLTDKEAVEAARVAYDALNEEGKGLVINVEILERAEARIEELGEEAVDNVIGLIDGLPKVEELQLTDKDAVETARAAYEALSAAHKELVTNIEVLEGAEAYIAELEDEAEEPEIPEVVTNVIGLIDDLPKVDYLQLTDKAAVEAARAAYEALSAEHKSLVTNIEVLEDAEAYIAELEKEPEEPETPEEVIKVIEIIDDLPNVDDLQLTDKAAVEAARAAYEALSAEHKGLVTNIEVLEDAEAYIAELEKKPEKPETPKQVTKVIELIDALPKVEDLKLTHKKDVEAARKAYDALTTEEKKRVTNLDTLKKAETRILELEQELKRPDKTPKTESELPKTGMGGTKVVWLGLIILLAGVSFFIFAQKRDKGHNVR